ncbi:MAG: universal stress protein, partial [Dokdonella sp.]
MRLAFEIAKRQAAHVVGIYCVAPLQTALFSPWGDPGYSDFISVQKIQVQYHTTALAVVGKMESAFRAEADRVGISSEWRAIEGAGAAPLIEHARYADLAVIGQVDPAYSTFGSVTPEEIVLSSGRPTLIVPHSGRFEQFGRRTLVAWNASREAARALGDALPLLVDAEAVTVLSINPGPSISGKEPGIELAHHLARHGIQAEGAPIVAKGSAVGEVLLARAGDFGADLIVMGAYGHSRS